MKRILLIAAVIAGSITAKAQSAHFSQFYSTPLLVNPANTGFTPGPWRVAANYRSQWNTSGSPYKTFTFSGDAKILQGRLADGNSLGIGIAFINDKTLEGVVQSNHLHVGAGYHIALDEDNIQSVSLGFQGSYNERRIDFSRLQFENQYGNGGFDPSLPIGENFDGGKKYYLDLNVGGLYSFALEDRSFFAGVGAYNLLNKAADNYLTEQFKNPALISIMAGGDIDVGVNNSFYLSGNYRIQGTSRELTVGAAYGIFIDGEGFNVLKLGLWHRLDDALIPYVGYTYKDIQVGASFDYTTSQRKTRAEVRNAFEISVLYLAPDLTELKRLIPWY